MANYSRSVAWLTGLTVFSIAVAIFAADPPAAPKAAEKTPAKPKVLVTISKETTYITEPLRSDGYPDYVAALNQRFSQGVTPENNSMVLFWKAMGPGEINEKNREKYFQMLGIPPLPEKGDYFVDSSSFITLHKSEFKGTTDEPNAEEQEARRQFDLITKRPWSKEEFPVWAKWVEGNEKPLALLIEASKRPRYYEPYIGDEVICILLSGLQQSREAVRGLVARAMYRLSEGKTDEAWEDLLASHRLARLVGHDQTLVGALVSITINWRANAGDQALLEHGKLSSAQIAKMRADLANLPPMPKMADKIDTAERFMFLDCVTTMARKGLGNLGELASLTGSEALQENKGALESLMDSIGAVAIDWDLILHMGNSWYDRIHDACLKPTRSERTKAWDVIDEDLKKMWKSAKDLKSLGFSMLGNPRKAISERVGQMFVSLLLPAISAAMTAEDRSTTLIELNDLAFALAAYRADHGSYPAKLADLSPKYMVELPKDLFNDADLHYRQEGNGYVLYSVGANGQDDGGKSFDALDNGPPGDDLVVRVPAVVKP